jgi:carboxymethylenebutenolidase
MESVERLEASDGHRFDCAIVPAEGTRRGGIVLLQEIFGVNDQILGVARRFAARGCEVAVPALFDRVERGAVVPFDQVARGRALMQALDPAAVMRDVAAAVARLARGGGPVAAVGFCWGGGLALRAAQVCPVAGAVAFYGTRMDQYLEDDLRAPVLLHFGETDDHVPAPLRAAVAARFPQAEAHLYAAGHAFANAARASHDPAAEAEAMARTDAFLDRVLG